MNERLHRTIVEAAGLAHGGDAVRILQCSSSGPTGAIILYAWAGAEPFPRLVIKTPREPSTQHSIGREWKIVTQMRKHDRLASLMPMAKMRFKIEGTDFYAYEGLPGQSMVATLRNRLLTPRSRLVRRFAEQALEVATLVHTTHSHLVSGDDIARDMLSDLAWLESWVPTLPLDISSRTRAYAAVIASATLPLPCGRVHGDFTPSNLLIRSTKRGSPAQPIDWEHSEAERPQHLDIFRFISTCELMTRRGPARRAAFRRMGAAGNPLLDSLFLPWLARLGVEDAAYWRTPNRLRGLWWHYCVHAARREQERLARPAEFQDSTFLRNLVAQASL